MPAVVTEIIVILLLIVVNGLFAMSEIAIISARKARLQQKADEGDHRARIALDLAETPNRFLSTVQIGITLIGILAGAFGGATLAEDLGAYLSRIPPLKPYGEAIGLAIVVLATTYLSLVIGELVPKRLALNSPERIAAVIDCVGIPSGFRHFPYQVPDHLLFNLDPFCHVHFVLLSLSHASILSPV